MEFLDDLRQKQEAKDTAAETGGADNLSWEELLRGFTFDDPIEGATKEEAKKPDPKAPSKGQASRRAPRASRGKKKAPRRGKGMLVFLAVTVFIAWGVIFALILRTANNSSFSFINFSQKAVTPIAAADVTSAEDAGVPAEPEGATASDSQANEQPLTDQAAATPAPKPSPPSVPGAPFTRFDREIQESPGIIDLYQLRGQEYLDQKAYEAALADFNYVLAVDDSRAEAYAGLGRVNFYLRRWNEAELAFQAALARNEGLSDAHFWLGHIYYYKGEYKAAAKAYDLAAEYDRSDAAAEAWLALASAQLNDYQETLGAVTRAMSITHDLAINYVASSWEHLLQDPPDVDGAQGDLLYARELAPNSFITLNALASFYLTHRPERLAEAELLAHYAKNWAANDIEAAQAMQTLGRVYLEKGLKADAEKIFIEAMELSTVDGIVILAGLPDDFARSRE